MQQQYAQMQQYANMQQLQYQMAMTGLGAPEMATPSSLGGAGAGAAGPQHPGVTYPYPVYTAEQVQAMLAHGGGGTPYPAHTPYPAGPPVSGVQAPASTSIRAVYREVGWSGLLVQHGVVEFSPLPAQQFARALSVGARKLCQAQTVSTGLNPPECPPMDPPCSHLQQSVVSAGPAQSTFTAASLTSPALARIQGGAAGKQVGERCTVGLTHVYLVPRGVLGCGHVGWSVVEPPPCAWMGQWEVWAP
jgi:hypothetical protein